MSVADALTEHKERIEKLEIALLHIALAMGRLDILVNTGFEIEIGGKLVEPEKE
jgi:hypothetical protein